MNTYELNGSEMKLREQFYYMFPISLAIITTSILLAFSSSELFSSAFSLLFAIISYPYNTTVTYISTSTGLYTLSRHLAAKAHALKAKEMKATGTMKANVLREKMEDGGFQERMKIIGDAEHELQELGKGAGKIGKGAGKIGKGAAGAGKKVCNPET
jgi:hypothetical protein